MPDYPVFTPMDEHRNKRLSFPAAEVKVISGNLNIRRRGKKAVVSIYGKMYDVFGLACGLPNCTCDAKIIPHKQ